MEYSQELINKKANTQVFARRILQAKDYEESYNLLRIADDDILYDIINIILSYEPQGPQVESQITTLKYIYSIIALYLAKRGRLRDILTGSDRRINSSDVEKLRNAWDNPPANFIYIPRVGIEYASVRQAYDQEFYPDQRAPKRQLGMQMQQSSSSSSSSQAYNPNAYGIVAVPMQTFQQSQPAAQPAPQPRAQTPMEDQEPYYELPEQFLEFEITDSQQIEKLEPYQKLSDQDEAGHEYNKMLDTLATLDPQRMWLYVQYDSAIRNFNTNSSNTFDKNRKFFTSVKFFNMAVIDLASTQASVPIVNPSGYFFNLDKKIFQAKEFKYLFALVYIYYMLGYCISMHKIEDTNTIKQDLISFLGNITAYSKVPFALVKNGSTYVTINNICEMLRYSIKVLDENRTTDVKKVYEVDLACLLINPNFQDYIFTVIFAIDDDKMRPLLINYFIKAQSNYEKIEIDWKKAKETKNQKSIVTIKSQLREALKSLPFYYKQSPEFFIDLVYIHIKLLEEVEESNSDGIAQV